MSARSVPIRRRLALLAGCAVGLLGLLLLAQGRADGKPAQRCAKGAEKAGCKLPVGARFQWETKKGESGTFTAEVTSKGWVAVTIYDVTMKCDRYAPLLGDETYLAVGLTVKQQPKVGKTYTVTKTDTRGSAEEGEGVSTSTIRLKLQFKTAKRLVATFHLASDEEGKVLCNGSGTWALKRQ